MYLMLTVNNRMRISFFFSAVNSKRIPQKNRRNEKIFCENPFDRTQKHVCWCCTAFGHLFSSRTFFFYFHIHPMHHTLITSNIKPSRVWNKKRKLVKWKFGFFIFCIMIFLDSFNYAHIHNCRVKFSRIGKKIIKWNKKKISGFIVRTRL